MRPLLALSLVLVVTAASLAGCGTPQPALDQANNGAALLKQVQNQVKGFRASTAAYAKIRIANANLLLANAQKKQGDIDANNAIDAALGQAQKQKWIALVQTLADARIAASVVQTQASAKQVSDTAKLIAPLPYDESGFEAAEKAMADLGTDLKDEDIAKLYLNFGKALAQAVKVNDAKIKAAEEKATAQATVTSNQTPAP